MCEELDYRWGKINTDASTYDYYDLFVNDVVVGCIFKDADQTTWGLVSDNGINVKNYTGLTFRQAKTKAYLYL